MNWQKMCHLGSPANKRCAILIAGLAALVTIKVRKIHMSRLNFNYCFFVSLLNHYSCEKAVVLVT